MIYRLVVTVRIAKLALFVVLSLAILASASWLLA